VGFEMKNVETVIDSAVSHKWGVPEFQRGFVWTRQKVRDLLESLWLDYPVGSFLLWYAPAEVEPRVVADGSQPTGWLVDGQQRSTALCVLFGRKPYWWDGDWNRVLDHHDIRYNVLAEEGPFFQLASSVIKRQPEWVKVRPVLNGSDDELSDLAQDLATAIDLPFGRIYSKLDRIRSIRTKDLPVVTVTLDLEDVTEVFSRLNSAGTKVTEADIALALAASQNPGWARNHFLPFIHDLDDAGFEIDPNLVFRSMISIDLGRAVLRDVPRSYWSSDNLNNAWKRTKDAWQNTIAYIEPRGVLSADVLPTKNALIPLVVLFDRYSDALSDDRAFAWLLHATRAGRYGGAAITAIQSDVKTIKDLGTLDFTFDWLHRRLSPWEPFQPTDFHAPYTDRVLRLFLYLVMFQRGAKDWITGQRLGFVGTELLERFNPQWHHIYPRNYLKNEGVPEEKWDRFANIAVISPTTNIRIGAKSPPNYIDQYHISPERLSEQLIAGKPEELTIGAYDAFLEDRASALTQAANDYMAGLGSLAEYELNESATIER
jgi:hypothetical protein